MEVLSAVFNIVITTDMELKFRTILDLAKVFPDERSCHHYLAQQRWGGLMICPHEGCGNEKAYVFKDGLTYKCTKCLKKYNAKTGTFMEGSKLRTITWLMAMYLATHKRGISSTQLAKDLGVTQKTAWFMLQRIRWAFGNEKPEVLEGIVEIDESFVGGKARFKHKNKRIKYNPGRGWADKSPVYGMLQRGGKVKAMVIPNVLMTTLRKATLEHVKIGSLLMGDGFNGYRALTTSYKVYSVDHGKGFYGNGDIHSNGIENFWSHFKRHIGGTHIKVSRKHLDKYVKESVFRYNYRNLDVQSQFAKIIENMNCRLKYKDLIAN